jgi:hypothetical protein
MSAFGLPPSADIAASMHHVPHDPPVYSQEIAGLFAEINVTVTATAARHTGIAGWGAANYYSVR